MAVTRVPANSTLRLELNAGTDASGKPIVRSKNLSGVKSTAADQDLFDVAAALAGLQEYPLSGIERVDNAGLVQA
ncbi:MAG: DUF1659 domain-containing protein [Eubacteriales bacterium]